MSKPRTVHILVVDDEEDVLFIFKYQFKNWVQTNSAKLSFAKSGEEALELLEDVSGKDIILILSDINMPGINGLELVKKVRERYPKIITILISAYSKEKYRVLANEASAYDFFEKPVNFQKLKSTITNLFPQLEG